MAGIRKAGSSPRGRGTRAWGRRPGQSRRFIPARRGTLGRAARGADVFRFIPARAGNTPRRPRPRRPAPVHPRAGGEHVRRITFPSQSFGSSPRGRGTHPSRGFRCLDESVHPRAGGEHFTATHRIRIADGSSPRGRGTLEPPGAPQERRRFIPARAGNTRPASPSPPSTTVHPRAGGEHAVIAGAAIFKAGSSPRGRGTLALGLNNPVAFRFIPARAGNTSWRTRGSWVHSVHPARAGNTTSRNAVTSAPPVHPRAGGEHERAVLRIAVLAGSSPRGRGTRRRRNRETRR